MSRAREKLSSSLIGTMTTLDSLPPRPLDGDTVLALNGEGTDMAVMPISYYEETQVYSMVVMTDEHATVVGFDGNGWTVLTRTEPNSEEEFDPEGAVDEWTQETHPDLYDDPAFEVTSEDYDLE